MAGSESSKDLFKPMKWRRDQEDNGTEGSKSSIQHTQRHSSSSSTGSRARPSIASSEASLKHRNSSFTSFDSRTRSSLASIGSNLPARTNTASPPSWYEKSTNYSAADPKLPSSARFQNSDTEVDEDEDAGVATHRALTDFAKIARQNRLKDEEHKLRVAKYRQDEETNQKFFEDLYQWHFGKENGWLKNIFSPSKTLTVNKTEMLDLANYHFPPRSDIKVHITDFGDSRADSYEIPLSKFQDFMSNKGPSVKVRWMHVPLGIGPLHSTIEDVFLYAGKRGRQFEALGRYGWPFAEIEVLNLQSRRQYQQKRDAFHMLREQTHLLDGLNQRSWNNFEPQGCNREESILQDLKWRTTHLGLADDEKTLPDFWTVASSDISWQLGEGVSMPAYGPLERIDPIVREHLEQALHRDKTYGSVQIVRDVFRCFHRDDGKQFIATCNA